MPATSRCLHHLADVPYFRDALMSRDKSKTQLLIDSGSDITTRGAHAHPPSFRKASSSL